MLLTSTGVKNGIMDPKYGRLGGNNVNNIPQLSIPLEWSDVPAGTQSLAIIFIDYDNYEEEGISWLHWSVANIPPQIRELTEGCSPDIGAIDSAIIQGKNSWTAELPKDAPECSRYGGPAPVKMSHEYEFRLYALDTVLDLQDGYYHNHFKKAVQGHVLEEAVMLARYIIV